MSLSFQASLSHESCSCVSLGNLSHSFSNTLTELLLGFNACISCSDKCATLRMNVTMDIQEQISVSPLVELFVML